MTDYKLASLKEARRLVAMIEDHYNKISYFHRLIELVGDLEKVDDIKLVLDAYLPYGRSNLEEIGQILKLLREAIKAN